MGKIKQLLQHIQAALEAESTKNDGAQINPSFLEDPKTKKELVLKSILDRSISICEEDLQRVEEDLASFFEEFKNEDYSNNLNNENYFRLLDLRDSSDARVVVIGDIHCDFFSLAALLLKLSVSKYEYFEKAFFVFLGDYLDRGALVFEHLLLLMDLKRILGDRLLMLKGNHELISYNAVKEELVSRVIPQDTCPVLNQFCSKNKKFLQSFGDYFKTLPVYVYLKVNEQNILLTHASIPRQIFLDSFSFDQDTGAISFDDIYLYKQHQFARNNTKDDSLTTFTTIVNDNILRVRNKILNDMIWGDPRTGNEKYQVSGRFEFGSSQFEDYVQKNNISRLFRSHEPEEYGYKSFYDDHLFTIFSTGGPQNNQTGYFNVYPAFAVINSDGNYFLEQSFIYKIELYNILDLVCDPFSEDFYNGNYIKDFKLNDEFYCTAEKALFIESLFSLIKKRFEEDLEEDSAQGQDELVPVQNEPENANANLCPCTEEEQDSSLVIEKESEGEELREKSNPE